MRHLLAMLMVLSAAPGVASASDSALHGCGTSVEGNVAGGWCAGSGTFRVVAACDDEGGRFARSPWVTISGGAGATEVTCRVRAVGAEIDEA